MHASDIKKELVRYYRGSRIVKLGVPHLFVESVLQVPLQLNEQFIFSNRLHVVIENGQSFKLLKSQEFAIRKLGMRKEDIEAYMQSTLDMAKDFADKLVADEQWDTYEQNDNAEAILNPVTWDKPLDDVATPLSFMRVKGMEKDDLHELWEICHSEILYNGVNYALGKDTITFRNVRTKNESYTTPAEIAHLERELTR